jgi:hypothetical protein
MRRRGRSSKFRHARIIQKAFCDKQQPPGSDLDKCVSMGSCRSRSCRVVCKPNNGPWGTSTFCLCRRHSLCYHANHLTHDATTRGNAEVTMIC